MSREERRKRKNQKDHAVFLAGGTYHNRISLTDSTTTCRKKIYNLAFRKGIDISLPFSTQKHKIIATKENVDVINDSCKNV